VPLSLTWILPWPPAAQGFPEREQALRWLDVELPNLTAAAGINQRPSKAIDLALALAQYGAGNGRLVDGDVER
jgi:hypothetical protein